MQHDCRAPLIDGPNDLSSDDLPTQNLSIRRLISRWMGHLWTTSSGVNEVQKKYKYPRLSQHATTGATKHRKQHDYLHSFLSPALSSQPLTSPKNQWVAFSRSHINFGGGGIGAGGWRLFLTLASLTLGVISVLLLIESLYLLEARGSTGRILALTTDYKLEQSQFSQRNLQPANSKISTLEVLPEHPHWLLWTKKCHIPRLDPWDKSIADYLEYREPLDCAMVMQNQKRFYAMTFVDENRLKFRDFAIQAMAVERQLCCYQTISRGSDDSADLEYAQECTKITVNNLEAPAPLIQVRCDIFNYTNVHSFIVHDNEEELAISQIMSENLVQDQYYNMIIVGVDTVSQLNGKRQFNKTLALLESNSYKVLDFVGYNKVGENTFPNLIPLLTGLTPQQLIDTKCWLASTYSMISGTGDDYLDNCKYLWTFFQELGYLTYFSEDWPQASTFNYLKMGFRTPPTTFYGRPFTVARDPLTTPQISMGCAQCLYERSVVELDLNNLKTFIRVHQARPMFAFHWINCPMHNSLNGGSTVDSILEDFFKVVSEIKRDRTFVLFLSDHGYRWNDFVSTRIGHYEASLPMLKMSVPSHFIQHHPDLYENLKSHQSALITPFDLFHTIMDIRNLGASEKFVEPFSKKNKPLIRRKYLESTPLETSKPPHRKDFLGELTQGTETKATVTQLQAMNGINFEQQFRTLSLLTSHTIEQLDRSCDEAGIPDSYCVCMEFVPVPSDTPDVIGAAQYLVYVHIYSLLKDHLDKCHFLDLESITSSDRYIFKEKRPLHKLLTANESAVSLPQENVDDYDISNRFTTPTPETHADSSVLKESKLPASEYRITVSTKPGQALFHEVVRMYGNLDTCIQKATETNKLINSNSTAPDIKHQAVLAMNEVCEYVIHSESISRLNLYKDQSYCIGDQAEVKKVCYCR